jgi:biopolymer transport protein ExbB
VFLSTLHAGLTALGQAAADGSAAASGVKVESLWDFVVKGGSLMIPIGACSLVAFTVIIERLISLRRSNVVPPAFIPGLKKVMDEEADRSEAVEYCQKDGSPIANILAAGIKRLGESVELLERHIQEAGEREIVKLRKYLRSLSVVASIAPLLGLLGTIFGMIKAFQTVATSAESLGKAELLAKGIYEAMITTAAGLLVAIPVLVAYHYLSARIDGLVMDMDRTTVDFIEEYAEAHQGAAPATPKLRAAKAVDDENGKQAETA